MDFENISLPIFNRIHGTNISPESTWEHICNEIDRTNTEYIYMSLNKDDVQEGIEGSCPYVLYNVDNLFFIALT